MKDKNWRLLAVVLFGLTIIIEIVRIFVDFNYELYAVNPLFPIGDAVCMTLYSVCFAVNLKRYLNERTQ